MNWLRNILASWLCRNLLVPIEERDVLKTSRKPDGEMTVYWQGKELPDDQIRFLKSEANALRNSDLWKLLENTLRYEAAKKMFYESKTGNELLFGKAMLYNFKVVNRLLDELEQL